MAEVANLAMPEAETDELGRYLEDTITIDWQTPEVSEGARVLLEGQETPDDRVRAVFEFVRDEVSHSLDESRSIERATCRASEVLSERTGLCYAKSHLLAGLLRYAGFPTGFCYVRQVDPARTGRFVLHGFNAVYMGAPREWVYLDARGNNASVESECRFEEPWSLAASPNVEEGEGFLPFIYKRPGKRILDLLERAPDFETVIRNLPDAL